jgi:hypothetical protein
LNAIFTCVRTDLSDLDAVRRVGDLLGAVRAEARDLLTREVHVLERESATSRWAVREEWSPEEER